MGGYVTLVFVSGGGILDKLIKITTRSIWSHVTVMSTNSMVEAIPPQVTVSPLDKYLGWPTEAVPVFVADPKVSMLELERLVGKPYGFLDCFSGLLHDITDIDLPMTGERTVNCCEVAVRVLRAGGTDPDSQISDDCWTPQSLYAALKQLDFVPSTLRRQ